MYKKILLTQFAIPNLSTLEYKSNVHLAPGYLVGYVKDNFPNTKFIITPRIYTDLLTELAFVEYAVKENPDLFVFSLYLWNIEKSLRIVKKLKTLLPNTKFLFGGPEVNPDNRYLLDSKEFSEGIVGEGEVPFNDYLAGKPLNKIAGYLTKNSYNDFKNLRKDYTPETNPYLANIIETKPDNTLFFESIRGCPFSCNFCYYNKVYDKIISVGHEHIEQIFNYARENNFKELFLLDPTFNIQPNFDKLLDKMIELNRDHYFEISTELRADFLTDSQIEKLVKLNLVEAEIGLQTTNENALRAMARDIRTEETIERTKKMIDAGISCKVDLIVGLPLDNLESFKRSIDHVKEVGISEFIQVFRLSILSGTEYSKERKNLGIDAEKLSPYYLTSNPTFSSEDIREALDYTEDIFNISLYPVPPYLLSTNFENLPTDNFVEFDSEIKAIHKLIIESDNFDISKVENHHIKLCETLVVHYIIKDSKKQISAIIESLIWLKENHSFNVYQFILEFKDTVDLELLEEVGEILPGTESTYLSRDTIANIGEDLNLTSSLVIITPEKFQSTDEYFRLKDRYDLFLKIENFDQERFRQAEADENFIFSGEAEEEVFDYLKKEDKFDDFMLFDSFKYEMLKESNEQRIYRPVSLII